MGEVGLAGLTMDAISKRAGVGKPTIYRWWPNRHAVAMAALMDEPIVHLEQKKNGSIHFLFEQQLCLIAETLTSRQGRNLTAIIATADPDTEIAKAFRHHFILTRRAEGKMMLEQGVNRRELCNNVDIEVILDQLYGALFFRVLLGHAPIDTIFVHSLVKQVFNGLANKAISPHHDVLKTPDFATV
jgi:AcrR family transcriptional regulator